MSTLNFQCETAREVPLKELRVYVFLYNNKINARVLIGQSAMVNCAGEPLEKSRVF